MVGVVTGVVCVLLLAIAPAHPQPELDLPGAMSEESAAPPPLRIATHLMRPDAFEQDGELVGFSVDIGRAVAEHLHWEQTPVAITTHTKVHDVLAALRTGEADLAVAAIPITSQYEREFDFSHPILAAGLQIMVPEPSQQRRSAEQEILQRITRPNLLRLSAVVALLMVIPAHVVWYFERKSQNSVIEHTAYFPGIFEALWWTVLALVGQAEEMPDAPVGRLVALFWVFVGIVYLTYFTAGLTAEMTLQELRGGIHGLEDLQNRPVALVADDTVVEYLEGHNLRRVIKFDQPELAYQALADQEVDAIIAPRPILLHFATFEPEVRVEVVGTPFLEKFYAIAMPEGSPYRTPVNLAILALREDDTYAQIYRKWFGVAP